MVMASLCLLQDWKIGAHDLPPGVPAWAAEVALALVVLGYALLLLRGIVRRQRYRATQVLGTAELARVHAALAAAERRTVGEILPVVLERSDRHPGAAWLAALSTALAGSVALVPWLPWHNPPLLLLAQVALGALGYAAARLLPDFQRFFLSEARASEMAEEQALQEFHRHGLQHTEARTGVLLFVSLLEHRAIVLADEGIHARVEPETWAATNELLLAGLRHGSLCDGMCDAIASAGGVLAEHFPVAAGDRNEIPDRIIVRNE
jgi:putative membrane protein